MSSDLRAAARAAAPAAAHPLVEPPLVETVSPGRSRTRFSSIDLLMLLTVLIWGLNFTVIKIALQSFSPLAFNAVRFSLATLVLLFMMRLRGESFGLSRRDLVGVVLLGLAGHTLYQMVFIRGLANTTPGNTSLLMATSPIFVVLYAHVLGVERGNRLVWAGILVSFAGVLLLILGGANGLVLDRASTTGDLLVLAASMLWAVYTVGSKPLLARHSPLKLTALAMLAGAPLLVLFSLPDLRQQNWAAVPPMQWLGLVYSALLSVVVGYLIWGTGVQRVGSARTAIYSNLTPVVAIFVAWLVLGDRLTLLQWLGAAVVIGGLLLTRRGRVPQRAQV
jgi:drug/metabolite transporter (DMT)-like permease